MRLKSHAQTCHFCIIAALRLKNCKIITHAIITATPDPTSSFLITAHVFCTNFFCLSVSPIAWSILFSSDEIPNNRRNVPMFSRLMLILHRKRGWSFPFSRTQKESSLTVDTRVQTKRHSGMHEWKRGRKKEGEKKRKMRKNRRETRVSLEVRRDRSIRADRTEIAGYQTVRMVTAITVILSDILRASTYCRRFNSLNRWHGWTTTTRSLSPTNRHCLFNAILNLPPPPARRD